MPASPNSRLPAHQRNGLLRTTLQRQFTPMDYAYLLWRGKWWILGVTAAVCAAAFYYTWTRPFIYEATAQLLVSTTRPPGGIVFVGLAGQEDRTLRNELMQMSSHETMQEVAAALLRREPLPITRFAQEEKRPVRPATWRDSVEAVAARLRSVLTLTPIRDADIVEIRVRTTDPHEAAVIANTFAEVYLQVNERNNRANARRVREFLQQQYEWTRDTLSKAERALQEFMSRSGAVELDVQANALVTRLSELDGKATEARIARDALRQTLAEYQRQLREIEPRLAEELAAVSSPYIESLQRQIARLEVERDLLVSSKPVVASPAYLQTQIQQLDSQIAELKEKLRQRTEELKQSKLSAIPLHSESGGPTAALQTLRQKAFEVSVQLQAEEARFGREPGLVNVLIGALPLEEACRPSGIASLDILTCGPIPPNPSELLGSERTRRLFEQLRQRYDLILVDTPPVIAVTDALVLAPLVQLYVLVARANETRIEALLKAQELLERVAARIVGVVLNEFDVATTYGSYYRYYRYYKYYHYYADSERRRRPSVQQPRS
jgi:capsular exopolysaccharide synthesis family protein